MNGEPEEDMAGDELSYDVVVVGAGNAAACAALAAREQGASVCMLESAPREERGGNSTYTAGAMRIVYDGVEDLKTIVDITDHDLKTVDFGSYTSEQFFDDMGRVTGYRTDPDLTELLVTRSLDTVRWMKEKGVRFQPSLGRQAYKVDGRFKFWGGLSVEVWGGGPGLVDALLDRTEKEGIDIRYDTAASSLVMNEVGEIAGVTVRASNRKIDIAAKAVVLACGGFEANAEMRSRYLGPNWDLAKVRGSRFNTGAGIRMALDVGAMPYGHWSGAHAVAWELNAPAFGDLAVGDNFQKHSYPFGIVVNARGERFLDEGADFRNYTYAKYGREILAQPGMFAWQVFDASASHLLRDEYKIKEVTRAESDTLEGLAGQLDGVDAARFLETVRQYNAAVDRSVPFDPNIKDGRCTTGLAVPKSNWANPLEEPPFVAYAVTCGITFTFGGIRVDTKAQVLNEAGQPIPGLFAAGELVGGLFYHNYPGGTGLTSGAVFGRTAGDSAAEYHRRA